MSSVFGGIDVGARSLGTLTHGATSSPVTATHPDRARSERAALALGILMLGAGITHFVFPGPYQKIVPRVLRHAAFWVRWSGIAEVACSGLLMIPRTRRMGALATAVLLLAVFPANVKMALDGGLPGHRFPLSSPLAAWARLPLQVPLVVCALRIAQRSPPVIPALSRPKRSKPA